MKKSFIPVVIMLIVASLSGCRGKMPPNTVYSEEDMEGRQVGVVLNSAAMTYAAGKGTIHEYTSAETMLVDLKNGAIDCAVMDESVAKPLLGKVSGLKILSKPLLEAEFCFAIAKETPI
jgi:ABC-type amino acid transport substrate-binding protein